MKPSAAALTSPLARKVFGQPLTQRGLVAVGVALLVVTLLALTTTGGKPMVMMALPVALAAVVLTLIDPFVTFVGMLCAVSLLPSESRLFGIFIPNWMQLMIPLLLLGSLLHGLGRRGSRTFAISWADLFIVAFIIFGYIAIFGQRGPATFKFYTNQQVMPMLMYFVAKWLPIDREKFHLQLRWQLLSVFILAMIMLCAPLGFDPVYHGFERLRLGEMARGPMWSISDTVAYTAMWPVFFMYAMAMGLATLPRRWRRMWPVGLALIILASMATTERTGPAAIALGMAIVATHRQLRKYVLVCLAVIPVVIPLWLFIPGARDVVARLNTVKEQGTGFERHLYREKTLRYVRSPYWNPVLGTGFGRISELSMRTVPQDQWVYDYNWQDFRPLESFASRPTHCAPVTLFAEYGYGGVSLLLMAIMCVAAALLRLPLLARQRGMQLDSALMLTAVAAFAGVLVNGMLHNTESVVEVLISVWVFSGLVVGHPDVFLIPPAEKTADAQS